MDLIGINILYTTVKYILTENICSFEQLVSSARNVSFCLAEIRPQPPTLIKKNNLPYLTTKTIPSTQNTHRVHQFCLIFFENSILGSALCPPLSNFCFDFTRSTKSPQTCGIITVMSGREFTTTLPCT